MLEEKNKSQNQPNIFGDNALIEASKQGMKELVAMLLQQEHINVNKQERDGCTALLRAHPSGHKEIVQMLEEKNMNQKQQNIYGDGA